MVQCIGCRFGPREATLLKRISFVDLKLFPFDHFFVVDWDTGIPFPIISFRYDLEKKFFCYLLTVPQYRHFILCFRCFVLKHAHVVVDASDAKDFIT